MSGRLSRSAIRILRIHPIPEGQLVAVATTTDPGYVPPVAGDELDKLVINVEVIRNPREDMEFPPEHEPQGEAIVVDRAQAVMLREVLDAYITQGRHKTEAQKRAEEIISDIRLTGDPYGRITP